jgi:protein-S-isoprenylcysteine O-methyltransferase Ste14
MPLLFATLFLPALADFKYLNQSRLEQLQWELFCLAISLLGLMVRILTVAYISEQSSGRELSNPRAEKLNTSGAYSLVRNPLYLGNLIIWLGITALVHLWWFSLMFMLIAVVYYRQIIIAEEDYLRNRFGAPYIEWADRTPPLIPSLRNWVPPALPFSLVMVIRREYSGLFQIVAVFSFINGGLNFAAQGSWVMDRFFQYLFIVVSGVCAVIWFLVKKTSLLQAPGGR